MARHLTRGMGFGSFKVGGTKGIRRLKRVSNESQNIKMAASINKIIGQEEQVTQPPSVDDE